ncbi:MAG: hypothetical protein IPK68_19680 [Bdellovibrionales bacterium]|nr:hypothetical protein [Bdellovibrionales bacterium]
MFALWVWLSESNLSFLALGNFACDISSGKEMGHRLGHDFFFGGWSWSASHTLLSDSGSHWFFLIGYSDAVLAVLTLIAYFTVWVEEIKDVSERLAGAE